MREKAVLLEEKDMERALSRIAHEILEKNKGTLGLALVGIKMRGDDLARRIAAKIEEAELDPDQLLGERRRFDPVGHYSRPDVLRLEVNPSARAADGTPSTRPSGESVRP